jgi:hypothetical protein
MSVKLILVCREGEARQAYLNEAKAIGMQIDVVSAYGELFNAMIETPYQGVMVDLITSMKASKEEKGIAQEIIEVFPIIQLKWDDESKVIRTISLSKSQNSDSLADFVSTECEAFSPLAIRLNVRKSIHFNTVICREEKMTEKNIEKTVTINASKGGCFLFSVQDWSRSLQAWIIINELQDKTPISGDIRWKMEWGKTMMIPGIGINFKQIKTNQLEELTDKYSL